MTPLLLIIIINLREKSKHKPNLTVCSYHVTYAFQSEFTLFNCLNVKQLLARSRLKISSLSDCNWGQTYSQMHGTNKHPQHSSVILQLCLNGRVFVYELSGCGFQSSCSHLNFRFCNCFEQGVPWHSGNYRVWIHSETRTWHDKTIQSNASYR